MKNWHVLILRYLLGIIMFIYAYIKIVNFQFAIPDDIKSIPIREADGVILTFSFLGYSAKFSFILGIAELIPSILLLFKRTAFVGALLLFPILSFILLINLSYDFVTVMKIWTGSLLCADVIILIFYRERFAAIFHLLLTLESPSKPRKEWYVNVLLIMVLAVCMYFLLEKLAL